MDGIFSKWNFPTVCEGTTSLKLVLLAWDMIHRDSQCRVRWKCASSPLSRMPPAPRPVKWGLPSRPCRFRQPAGEEGHEAAAHAHVVRVTSPSNRSSAYATFYVELAKVCRRILLEQRKGWRMSLSGLSKPHIGRTWPAVWRKRRHGRGGVVVALCAHARACLGGGPIACGAKPLAEAPQLWGAAWQTPLWASSRALRGVRAARLLDSSLQPPHLCCVRRRSSLLPVCSLPLAHPGHSEEAWTTSGCGLLLFLQHPRRRAA